MSSESKVLNGSTSRPSSPARLAGPLGCRDAAERQAASGQRGQQVADRRSGAEPDRHAVLDEQRRRLGGDLLLVFSAHGAPVFPITRRMTL